MRANFVENWSVAAKIRAISFLTVSAFVAGIFLYLLPTLETRIYEEKTLAVRSAVETAMGVVKKQHEKFKGGGITESGAKGKALALLREMRHSGDERIWIQGFDGRMVMDPSDAELFGKDLSTIRDSDGKAYFSEMTDIAKNAGEGRVDISLPKEADGAPAPRLSYVIGFPEWDWILGTGVFIDNLKEELFNLRLRLAAASLVFSLFLLLASHLAAKMITRPIVKAASVAGSISRGEVSARVDKPGGGEVGELCRALNQMGSELEGALGKVNLSAEKLGVTAVGVNAVSRELKHSAAELASKGHSLESAAGRMEKNMRTVHSAADLTGEHMKAMTGAASTMADIIGRISDNAVRTTGIAGKAVESAHSVQAKMTELDAATERIGKVAKAIDAISDNSKLLALNATIEAARAGDAGKGFGVVAVEMKDLATQTMTATAEIAAAIRNIQGANRNMFEAVGEIAATVSEAHLAANEIQRSVEEQRYAAVEIETSVYGTTTAVEETNRKVAETLELALLVAQEARALRASADTAQAHSGELDKRAVELTEASSEIGVSLAAFKSSPVVTKSSQNRNLAVREAGYPVNESAGTSQIAPVVNIRAAA